MQNLLTPRYRNVGNFSIVWVVLGISVGAFVVWGMGQPWFPLKIALNVPGSTQNLVSPEKKQDESQKEKKTESAYTAVYLDTDQIFYGKAGKQSGQYLFLTDAFYYQPGITGAPAGNIRIIKVGTELHKPKDEVSINRSHVVMTEQLTEESKVTQAILKYKAE